MAKLIVTRARSNLVDFEIATNDQYEPNWHHELISQELEHIEKNGDRDYKVLIVSVPPRHGKQMAHDTPVLTTKGWRLHGELVVGDFVFGRDGKPKKILALSEESESDYVVKFSDGAEFYTHGNHEWVIQDRKKHKERILETKELFAENLSAEGGEKKRGHRYRFNVDANVLLDFKGERLPIHPYTLGAWLGDGKSNGGSICGDKKDRAIVDKMVANGEDLTSTWIQKNTGVYYYGFSGLIQKLGSLDLKNNKHIPTPYLMASKEDRLELLAGLIDTDGSRDKNSRYRFSTCNKILAKQVRQLVLSLGGRAYMMEYEPVVSTSGIVGRKITYQVGFNLDLDIPVVLERKKNLRKNYIKRCRSVVEIKQTPDVKTGRCIQVEGGVYLVGETFIPTHNSQQVSIDFPAWYLGRNPKKEIIAVSYSADLAQEFGGKTREKVDSEEYRTIFPEVRLREDERARGRWKTEQGGSYTATGVGGPITGKGANILLIDDPTKNREEAESETLRNTIWGWFTSTAFTRLSPGGVVVIIMTRWHLDDLAGKIIAHPELSKRTKVISLPAVAEHDEPPYRKQGEALWQARYPLSALEEIKSTVGPYDWSSLFMGSPVLTENQEFRSSWIKVIPEERVQAMNTRGFLTIDTAMSKKNYADFTGFCDNRVNDENFWHIKAWQMKLGPEELVDAIFSLHAQNHYEAIGIETTSYTQGLKPYLDAEQRKRGRFLPIVELKHNQIQKEIRIRGLIPLYASGTVFHIQGQCYDLEEQMRNFPFGAHDDLIDALSYQLQIADGTKSSGMSVFIPTDW